MGLANWFQTFCSNIQVQNTSAISTRYKRITSRLNKDFWNTTSESSHSLYVGSFGRQTAINGFSDLDMTFELPSSIYARYDAYTSNGQSALLQEVKGSIQKTYSDTSIRADGQVIEVPFSDGITFEVVPVFINAHGTYTYPDASSGGEVVHHLIQARDRGYPQQKYQLQSKLDSAVQDDAFVEVELERADRGASYRHACISIHR